MKASDLDHSTDRVPDEVAPTSRPPPAAAATRTIARKASREPTAHGAAARDLAATGAGDAFADAMNAGIHAPIQRHGAGDVAAGADRLVARAATGSGHALPDDLRTRFESSLGADLGGVRVHTDGAAAAASSALGARAYATGQDVFMGAGEYQPGSADGAFLLAHEVAHTVQQRGASSGPQFKLAVSSPGDASEAEADRAAAAMVGGHSFSVTGAASGIHRRRPGEAPDPGNHLRPGETPMQPAAAPQAGNPAGSTPTQGGDAVEPLPPGPDYQSDPRYIDNYSNGSYDLLTNVLSLGYPDGGADHVDYTGIVNRQVSPTPAPAGGSGGGGIHISMTVYSRDRHGRIRPNVYNQQTTPNLMAAVHAIEAARRSRERQIIGTIAEGTPTITVSWGATGMFRLRRGSGGAAAENQSAGGGQGQAQGGGSAPPSTQGAASAPGQAGHAPASAPGQVGGPASAPGQAGHAPVSAPGQAGHAPASAPGQAGHAPASAGHTEGPGSTTGGTTAGHTEGPGSTTGGTTAGHTEGPGSTTGGTTGETAPAQGGQTGHATQPQAGATSGQPAGGGRFASEAQLQDHFQRHGSDFGASSPAEYTHQADAFLNGSRPSTTLERVRANGDRVRYNPATEEFGVARPDGTIRTYYRPNPAQHGRPTNLDYFNAQ